MNAVSELNELCQKQFGASLTSEVLSVVGAAHCPVVTVKITLPDGDTYTATGKNQKEARRAAARDALEWGGF